MVQRYRDEFSGNNAEDASAKGLIYYEYNELPSNIEIYETCSRQVYNLADGQSPCRTLLNDQLLGDRNLSSLEQRLPVRVDRLLNDPRGASHFSEAKVRFSAFS